MEEIRQGRRKGQVEHGGALTPLGGTLRLALLFTGVSRGCHAGPEPARFVEVAGWPAAR